MPGPKIKKGVWVSVRSKVGGKPWTGVVVSAVGNQSFVVIPDGEKDNIWSRKIVYRKTDNWEVLGKV